MKKDILELFRAARRVSTPLIAIETSDQRGLACRLFSAVGNGDNPSPKFTFDLARGVVGVNDAAKTVIASIDDDLAGNPAGLLIAAQKFPAGSIIVMLNAQRYVEDGMVMQAICNLRDEFKTDRRTVVLLGPSFKLSSELDDVVVFDEKLPDDEQLRSILSSVYDAAVQRSPKSEHESAAIDAARGLPAFTAEQVFAMAMTPEGLDLESTWEHKKNIVNKTAGLKFVRDGQTFDDLGGLDSAKEFMSKLMNGPKRPGVIIFLDELDKSLAGAIGSVGDSSGVSQDFLGTWLSWMEDNFNDGLIAVGAPGTGKTALGMAVGPTFGIPTVVVDVGGFKGSLVGESERKLREALKVIDSIAGEAGAFVYATCNRESALPPELKRRFRSGRWYFDLPTREERESIWSIHQRKAVLVGDHRPDDTDWTGAEIRNCCDLAWRLNAPTGDVAKYVVPIAQSDPSTIAALRKAAHGRWLSASYPGPYVGAVEQEQKKQERSVEFA